MTRHEKLSSADVEEPPHHLNDLKQRLKRLTHPGHPDRIIYVASSPEEAVRIRKTLSSNSDESIECLIHGSDEHVDALKSIHEHHKGKKQELKIRHGPLLDDLEATLNHIQSLESELELAAGHAAHLDENFKKYGYSSNVRTHNVDHALLPPSDKSGATSHLSHDQWQAERFNTVAMRFYMNPILRQYEHKGILWRANLPAEVYTYELFIDLLYVGIMEISGEAASEEADGHTFLRFAVTFCMGWVIWSELTLIMSRFYEQDVFRRLNVVFHLTCLVGFTTNITGFYHQTYTPLVLFFVASAIARSALHLLYAFTMPTIRPCCVSNAVISLMASALWIGSIFVDATGGRQILIWTALFVDILGYEVMRIIGKVGSQFDGPRKWLVSHYEFVPGINIEHRVERMGSFTTLVFGYCIIALLFQSSTSRPFTAFLGKAVLGLLQVFALSAIYFEMDRFNLYTHAIRRHPLASVAWSYAHLPMTAGFVLSSSALKKIVTAHDCLNAKPEYLSESETSAASLTTGDRWFYCGGLGTTVFCLSFISMMHVYKTSKFHPFAKTVRQINRCVIGLAIILLGLTNLNSLHLISLTCGLCYVALFQEIVGNMLVNHAPPDRKVRCTADFKTTAAKALKDAMRVVPLHTHYHPKTHVFTKPDIPQPEEHIMVA